MLAGCTGFCPLSRPFITGQTNWNPSKLIYPPSPRIFFNVSRLLLYGSPSSPGIETQPFLGIKKPKELRP